MDKHVIDVAEAQAHTTVLIKVLSSHEKNRMLKKEKVSAVMKNLRRVSNTLVVEIKKKRNEADFVNSKNKTNVREV